MKSRFFVVAFISAFMFRPLVAQAQQVTFDFVGHAQTWTVPDKVTSVIVDVRGAQGGGNDGLPSAAGGEGGRLQTTLAVTPGETLVIYVGGRGGDPIGPNTAGQGGFNGGGAGGIDNVDFNAPAAGGGGASDIRQGGDDLAHRIAVAGGGGGAECCTDANGGDGGGTNGLFGATSGGGSSPGGGGTQFEGGAGGLGCNGSGGSGSFGEGGLGGNGNRAGGGGGGGYYGGGGGGGCLFGSGGGGGSSFSAGSNTIDTPGFQIGNGQVIIIIQNQGAPSQVTFDFVGHVQTWVVPNNVTSVLVDARGAQGGGNGPTLPGGKGGRVETTLVVTPNQTLFIYVGGKGGDLIGPNTAGSGGFNGGGAGGVDNVDFNGPAGGGGGASDVRQGIDDLADRVVVAGGGGGSECCTDSAGGNGGDLTGMSGGNSGGGSSPGAGGTQFNGGVGGAGCNGSGGSGSLGQGGVGGNGNRAGGGGGGGYYGGGGGGGCLFGSGGGGGSSFSSGSNTIHTQGFQTGTGQIIITFQDQGTLPQVTGLSAIIGDGSIYLRWNPIPATIEKFLVTVEQAANTSALNSESTIAFTAAVGVTFNLVGSTSCDPPLPNKAPSCLITSLQDGTPLVNGVCYRLTVRSVTAGLEGDPSNPVVACPNKFSNPGLPRSASTPILFLHGFFGDGRAFGSFGNTLDFMQRTLGWKYGGQLYHFDDELHTGRVHVDPAGLCDNQDPTLQNQLFCLSRDTGTALSTGDFFTASFGSNTAKYSDRKGLAHQGDEVDDFVNQLVFDGVHQPFTLVAHSNGGLAARDFITRFPAGTSHIAQLITYGTPHRGADIPASWLVDLLFDGARDAESSCSPDLVLSAFLTDLNTRTLPPSIGYVSLYGTSSTNELPLSIASPFVSLFRNGDRPADCRSAQWDGLVPASSADLTQADPVVQGSSVIRVLATKHAHMGQGEDFPSILCALDSNCAMFQVSTPAQVFLVAPVIGNSNTTSGTAGLQGSSPVDIDVIAPDGSRMGANFVGIAGASYMDIFKDNGQETINALVPFPQGGAYTVKAIARDGSLPTDSFTITLTQNGVITPIADHISIQDIPANGFQPHVNSRPFANAGTDQTVECIAPSGTPVTLNGSLSEDQDGDPLTFVWTDSQSNIVGILPSVTVTAAMGTKSYNLIVTDPSGLSATATTRVSVRDTMPPSARLTVTPSNLWPPNHNLVPITANIQANDACDSNPTVALVSIVSNEPDSGLGDVQGTTLFTDDRAFLLRAERLGSGTGRTYTITYRVTDHAGNVKLVSGQVVVPHDQSASPKP